MPHIPKNHKSLWTLTEILEDTSSPPKPIIDKGILLDGTILLIVGPAKSKKTFLTQNLALSIAMGEDFAGFKITKPKKVLYLLAEGGRYPNRDRIKKMAENISPDNTDNLLISFPAYLHINNNEEYECVYSLIKETGAEVVILDPFIRFHDADENSASAMSDVLGIIRQFIEKLEISVILVHHTGKMESRGGRGSSAIIGEYDSCITIHKEQNDHIRLTYDMRHVETPSSNRIRFNCDTFWFERENGIVQLLENTGGSLPKVDFIKAYNAPKSTAYKHIKKAVKEGLVKEEEGVLEIV